jgi:hypothetical protein
LCQKCQERFWRYYAATYYITNGVSYPANFIITNSMMGWSVFDSLDAIAEKTSKISQANNNLSIHWPACKSTIGWLSLLRMS